MQPSSNWSFVAISVLGGLAGGSVIAAIKSRTSIDPGDWLSFAGNLLGVALAVAGALWLESHRRRMDAAEGRRLLKQALEELLISTRQLIDPADPDVDLERQQGAIVASLHRMKAARDLLYYACEKIRFDNALLFRRIKALERFLSEHDEVMTRETQMMRQRNPTEAVLQIYRERMAPLERTVVPTITATLRDLDG